MGKSVGRLRWLSVILLVLVTYAVFQGSLSNLFLWDDGDLILKDSQIRSLKNIPRFFGLTYWKEEAPMPGRNFRPIRTTSFALDYFFWKDNPYGFHLTNLFFHIFNVLLVYFFVYLLLLPDKSGNYTLSQFSVFSFQSSVATSPPLNRSPAHPLIPLLSALFFATHPIHTEAVVWIKNRSELFCTFFFLSSLILFIKSQTRGVRLQVTGYRLQVIVYYLLSTFCFVLALLSKEMAITLPLILVFHLYFFLLREDLSLVEKRKKIILKTLPFWIVGLLYTFFRFRLIEMVLSVSGERTPVLGLCSHILLVIKTIGNYLQLLFFPVHLSAERLLSIPKSLFEPSVLIFLVVFLLLLFLAVKLFRPAKKPPLEIAPVCNTAISEQWSLHWRPAEEAWFGSLTEFTLFWIFFTILPASNIFYKPLYTRPFAEQRLYLPSVGFCIFLALLFAKALKRNNAITQKTSQQILRLFGVLALLGILVFYSVGTVRRTTDWHDSIVFWEKTVKSSPDSPRAHANLGIAYSYAERYEEAIQELKKSLDMGVDKQLAYFNLGIIYDKQGKTEEAAAMLEKELATLLSNEFVRPFLPSLKVAGVKGEYDLAHPAFVLGLFYQERNLYEKAIAKYKEALEVNPSCVIAHYHLAETYERKGQYEQAIFHYQQVIEIKPSYSDIHRVHFNLGNIYRLKGKLDEAISQLEKAVEIKPNFLEARKNLADAYKERRMYSQAIDQYKKVLEIDPKSWDAYFGLGAIYAEKELYKEAVEHYEKAVKLNPNFGEAHYNLGLVYLGFNRFHDAAQEFQKVLYLEPRNMMAEKMYRFALESAKQGDLPQEFGHP